MTAKESNRALCQYRGTLVLMECKPNPDGGSCFDCGGTKFFDDNGWIRCEECGFAILETDRVRIQNEYQRGTNLNLQ